MAPAPNDPIADRPYTNQPGDIAAREMRVTRLIHAPRELVFDAFLDPRHISHWWGPKGFTTTTHSMAAKVGGAWIYTMHGSDGKDWPNRIDYLEIVRPEKLVYDHGTGAAGEAPHFRTTVTFEGRGPDTFVTLCALFPTVAALEAVKKFGAEEGGRQTLEKLDRFLASSSTSGARGEPPLVGRKLALTRVVAAPRELVWKVWTDPQHLVRWFAPRPFSIPVCKLEVRAGGAMAFDMQGPDGAVHHCLGSYEQVEPPALLVFTAGVPGPDGQLLFNNRNTIRFEETGGRTTIRVEVEVIAAQPAAAPFIGGMEIGWNMTVDQCVEYALAQVAQ